MRILFIVPYVPGPVRTRSYNLIRSLADRGHQITLLTLWENDRERDHLAPLRDICHEVVAYELPRWRIFWNLMAAIPSDKPLQAVYSWQPALQGELKCRLLSDGDRPPYDVIHVEHLRAARYALLAKKLNNSALPSEGNGSAPADLPIIWDSVDCISHLFRQTASLGRSLASRTMARFELGRTEKIEGDLITSFSRTLVTSDVDKKALASLLPSGQPLPEIKVLPNGVDVDFFHPEPGTVREPRTLVVSGKMSYHANVTMVLHLVQEIMPLIWAVEPEVNLTIVGMNPPRTITALADHPAIRVTGTVEDMRPFLQKATVAVVPLRYGAGTQFKILEAMACGTPVVTSPLAARSLKARAGEELLIAAEPTEFADAVLQLLNDEQARLRLGQAGRRYVEQQHGWPSIARQLEEVYGGVVNAEH